MELRDKAVEAERRGKWFRNPFVIIIAALVGLGCIGVLILLLFLVAFLPAGRSTTTAGARATATPITLAQGTPANTPAPSSSVTPSSFATLFAPTATGTPAVIPNTTPSVVTTPASTASLPAANVPSPNPANGLYVTGLRVDPANPRKIAPINFYVTLVNSTGMPHFHKVCVEVFQPGDRKSFGITSCTLRLILPGTSEVFASGWRVAGIHECIALSARAIIRDEDEIRIPLLQPSGAALWLNLQVCP